MPKKIKNVADLELEVARLKLKKANLESELGDRVKHLQSNYKSMAVNSVMPGVASKGVMGIVGSVAKVAWKSAGTKSLLTNALVSVLEFAGVKLGIKLVDNFRQKRHRRKAAAAAKKAEEDENIFD